MKDCNQCGKCCIKYGGSDLAITDREIDQWEQHNPEIFKYVKDNEIWFDPESGVRLDTCPFLIKQPATNHPITKYTCSIYLHRPDDCRQYPTLINEMIRDGCEMIEERDLLYPGDAQRKLELLKSE